jgi:PHP family Zn ribbon phosphoesterase
VSLTSGLKFKKLDLQVHTPASQCFVGNGVTPSDIVSEAIKKELSGIAITDHNTGEWVDRIKEAARGTSLTVFPGIEVLVPAGKSGIHILAILDVNKGTKDIDELIGALKLKDVDGNMISQLGIYDVIDVITNDIHNGLAILAHCTGPKGAIFEMSGIQRKNLFLHHNLLAVDVVSDDFLDPEKTATKTRAIDLLDGNHQDFNYRKLAVIQTSDNPHPSVPFKHGLEGIGSRYSYFKLEEQITLEGLRLCFVDRETRIRQSWEYSQNVFPRIKSLKVRGGFLDGATVLLHDGLNCLLGAKGAGKSLVVEFLRFVLDQSPTQPEIIEDHNQKLEERLQAFSEVSATIIDDTGKELTLTRIYNPEDGSPFKEIGAESVARTFPVLFLSQNEIIRVAENEDEQLGFIDRFFDFRSYQARIQELEQQLGQLDSEFAECLRALSLNKEQKKQLEVIEKELEGIAAQMKNPVFDEFARADAKEKSFGRIGAFLSGLQSKARALVEREIGPLVLPDPDASTSDDPALLRMRDLSAKARDFVLAQLKAAAEEVAKSQKTFEQEHAVWKPQYEAIKRKYDEAVQVQKGDYKALETRRLRLSKEKEAMTKRIIESQALADKTKDTKTKRDELLSELNEIYKEYRRERLMKSKKFETDSGGKLSISINESTNVDEFKERLTTLKRGSYLSDDEIAQICKTISPYEFIIQILRFDSAERKQLHLVPISKATGVDIKNITKLAEHLLAESSYEKLLELQYRARPQDRPDIRYRVSSGRYEPLKRLSVGQKCTAMLMMALSDGTMPIVIDQPEDSLDIRSIWDDMCSKLRAGKDHRQFVFTTHNSSLAVASDTDKYTVLEADATSGRVVFSGAIDSEPVRKQVIEYLEGGVATYRAKYLKYNIPQQKLFS